MKRVLHDHEKDENTVELTHKVISIINSGYESDSHRQYRYLQPRFLLQQTPRTLHKPLCLAANMSPIRIQRNLDIPYRLCTGPRCGGRFAVLDRSGKTHGCRIRLDFVCPKYLRRTEGERGEEWLVEV